MDDPAKQHYEHSYELPEIPRALNFVQRVLPSTKKIISRKNGNDRETIAAVATWNIQIDGSQRQPSLVYNAPAFHTESTYVLSPEFYRGVTDCSLVSHKDGYSCSSDTDPDIDDNSCSSLLNRYVSAALRRCESFEREYRALCLQHGVTPLSSVLRCVLTNCMSEIDVSSTDITGKELIVLVLTIQKANNGVRRILVGRALLSIGQSQLKRLEIVLSNKRIRITLKLHDYGPVPKLENMLRTLNTLSIVDNLIFDGSKQPLKLLSKSKEKNFISVRSLSIGQCGLEDQHVADLCYKFPHLTVINLSWNHVRVSSLDQILKSTKNLEKLDLSWSGLRYKELLRVSKYLSGQATLKNLSLAGNEMFTESDAASKLADALELNSCLEYLNISNTHLSEDDGLLLLEKIHNSLSTSLTLLSMEEIANFNSQMLLSKMEELRKAKPKLVVYILPADTTNKRRSSVSWSDLPLGMQAFQKVIDYTNRQKMSLFDLFAAFSDQSSWTISQENLHSGIKRLDIPLDGEESSALMVYLDTDVNGHIDYGELLRGQKNHNMFLSRMSIMHNDMNTAAETEHHRKSAVSRKYSNS